MFKCSMRLLLSTILLICLAGCTSTSGYLLSWYADNNPSPNNFNICHGYSCRYKVDVTLPQEHWQQVQQLFEEQPIDAPQERQQIIQAIALLEQQAGQITGIKHDLPKSVKTKDTYGQQDCIDETVNTTTYLRMLQADNLLRWHRVSIPARRGYFVDKRWPHNTAIIEDITSNLRYAVDSWPGANGEPPEIKPVEIWYSEGQH